ncbi:cupin domain-containing protein [Granulicella tundricola]|uniref:Cupin 2 conserved barrel domain protein n=1 Tax=Granulicella tundricola (strain ATCC BAA-1859 / DSM 23138 / MP5ACTX9) TaxID=1198114 RepID=E8X0W9_GRATM|nr:cupin domain-containing protein [Granulicella tundricola]ADW70153.1 Cupin 2 conserved barrel domain protein [Granulicella tundricola MP5ACTX9]
MQTVLNSLPAQEGVRLIEPGEGKPFDLGPVHFQWKVRGEDSAHAYTIFELHLAPGGGVDLHSHASPESFYVLEGEMTFFRIVDGTQEAFVCGPGSTIVIPPNALHALFNKSAGACRLLDVSTVSHQDFFDEVQAADRNESFASLEPKVAGVRLSEIARRNEMYLAPYDVNTKKEID